MKTNKPIDQSEKLIRKYRDGPFNKAMEEVAKKLPCNYKKTNSQGVSYCGATANTDSHFPYEKVSSRCPYIGSEESVAVVKEFDRGIEYIDNLFRNRYKELTSDLGKKIFDKIHGGTPDENQRACITHPCLYKTSKKSL